MGERPDPWGSWVSGPVSLGARVERLCVAVDELLVLLRQLLDKGTND